ncbi:GTPase-associated protein 1-related protein [Streptomyces sp. NPDC052236]|uniref:GTPase-associated protein 1-related protein n=1 Tax=Streptomyces sp. NPDC052236 TaxID=3365686 RepID=UPI0037D7BD6A
MNSGTCLAQLHYTSAAPGPDGSGFRFTAVSEDVPANLLREIEQLIGYEPPRDAPSRPSPSELGLFPAAFTHSTLSDGSRLLCRSVYTGADYSGRYGNFHAHAVWLPDIAPVPAGLLPVELWESPSWSSGTPEDGRPEPLTELLPGRRMDRRGLTAFAAARAGRLPAFLADVRALFAAADAPQLIPQLIVVERDAHDTVQWIALASAVLPRELADRLTFTSYTRRPLQARQQIVGILPDADFSFSGGADHRYRVHDCTGGESSPPREDPWASVAARVWIAGLPRLFLVAEKLPPGGDADGAFDHGRLAAVAAAECVALDSVGRTAAARWAARHGHAFDAEFWGPLLATLAEGGDARTAEEWLALAPLADRLGRLAGHDATGPLKEELLGALASVGRAPLDVVLALLELADALSVETMGVLPVLAERASNALMGGGPETENGTESETENDEDAATVAAALGRLPAIWGAVLGELDLAASSGDPARLAAVARTAMPDADLTDCPHLRLGEAAGRRPAGDDPVRAFHSLVAEAGPEHKGRATVLSAAYRLVWAECPLTPAQARLIVNQLPPDWLCSSGIDDHVTEAALQAPAHDPDAPELAADLLRYATGALQPRIRGALSLLALAGQIADGRAAPGFTQEAIALCRVAQPLEAAIAERVGHAVARTLLSPQPPPGELEQLVRSGDPELLAAYADKARGDTVRDWLRASPPYVAACFFYWSSGVGLNAAWDKTRTALLADVLRPVVRKLPEGTVAEVVRHLERPGGGWAREFQEWNRPGRIARLGGRLRGRKSSDSPSGPPGEERRR